MDISFIKMHGLGNDFVILDSRTQQCVPTDIAFIQSIAQRRSGVGCDQVIVLESAPTADIFMHIYNQDGSVAGACGNATRCVAHLIMQETQGNTCVIETSSGSLRAVRNKDHITVNMGVPEFDWQKIPLSKSVDTRQVDVSTDVSDVSLPPNMDVGKGFCVNIGNPHVVFLCEDAQKIALSVVGKYIEHHPLFPERTNVEFISPLQHNRVRMRVWERGGMITDACGSGACAAFLASIYHGIVAKDREVEIVMDGGSLFMTNTTEGEILMSGPYSFSFKGVYTYEHK